MKLLVRIITGYNENDQPLQMTQGIVSITFRGWSSENTTIAMKWNVCHMVSTAPDLLS